MSNYSRGNEYERRCADRLRVEGYVVWQARGSKGPADILALKIGEILLVQVKGGKAVMDHHGWNALYLLAFKLGAIPLVADFPDWMAYKAGAMRMRRITGQHALGSRSWPSVPWVADRAAGCATLEGRAAR